MAPVGQVGRGPLPESKIALSSAPKRKPRRRRASAPRGSRPFPVWRPAPFSVFVFCRGGGAGGNGADKPPPPSSPLPSPESPFSTDRRICRRNRFAPKTFGPPDFPRVVGGAVGEHVFHRLHCSR